MVFTAPRFYGLVKKAKVPKVIKPEPDDPLGGTPEKVPDAQKKALEKALPKAEEVLLHVVTALSHTDDTAAIPPKLKTRVMAVNEVLTSAVDRAKTLIAAGATAPKGDPKRVLGDIKTHMAEGTAVCELVDGLLDDS